MELVRAFCAGDASAFGELIRRHQETVFRVVRRYACSADEARDLTQRAFLQALEAAPKRLRELSSREHELPFRAWLLRTAINLGKNQARHARRWSMASLDAEGAQRMAPSTQEAFERAESQSLTRRAVLQLPTRQREVLTLRIDAGLAFQEIATALGITEGNAKAHFHYAVKRLKEEVAKLSNAGGPP